MKSYTDIKQSKTLVNILSLESADAKYGYIAPYEYSDRMYDAGYDEIPYPIAFIKKDYSNFFVEEYDGELPCWSLVALLNIIGNIFKYSLDYNGISFILTVGDFEVTNKTAVDACYDMIVKLNELKLL